MRILTFILVLLLASCTLTYHVPRDELERSRNATTTNTSNRVPVQTSNHHRVVRGDTLYAIAWRYRLDYKQLAWWNQISPPYRIGIGQKIRLQPMPGQSMQQPVLVRPAPRPVPTPEPTQKPRQTEPTGAPTKPAIVKPQRPEVVAVKPAATTAVLEPAPILKWQWPVKGKLLDQFGVNPGINISGKFGQAVLASEAGKVVYSGGGLKGYGDLIIIKHSEQFLSAYAHNSRLLVKEGDQVYAGQTIAQLGKLADVALLHFEIRNQGKPIDPVALLPKR